MAVTQLFFLLLESIIHFVQPVGEELDEASRERMQLRALVLSQEMTRLLQEVHELEQRTQEPSGLAWRALLFDALPQWHFWATAALLVLFLGLCWWLRKSSPAVDSRGKEESSSSNTERQEEQHVQGFYQTQEEPEQEEEEREGEDPAERDVDRIFAKHIHWRVQNPAYRSQVAEELVATLVCVFQEHFSNPFFMVLQPATRVGSAFGGRSPCKDDAVRCLLVPQELPRGHAFSLELGAPGEMPAKTQQTELPRKDAAVQVPDCRECLSRSILTEGSRDSSCVRSDRVDDLLSLVAELRGEAERLRRIWECKKEMDRCSNQLKQQEQAQAERLGSITEYEKEIDDWCNALGL